MNTKTTSNNIRSNTNSHNTNNGAKARTKARKPLVAERMTVSAPVAVPLAAPPSTLAPPVMATPPATTAPSPGGGSGGATAPSTTASPPSTAGAPNVAADAPVGPPPAMTFPSVPPNFVPVSGADLRGHRPLQSEVAAVPDAILELQGFASYTALFGITAPPVDQLVERLAIALQWTPLLAQSAAWLTYVKSEEGLAWKDALELVDRLKVPFQLATVANPSLMGEYPALARLLGASKVVAKRSASTRAKKKKAEAKAQADAAAAAAITPSAPAAGANAASASAPPTTAPARIVTVQG